MFLLTVILLTSCTRSNIELLSEALEIYYEKDTAPNSVGYYTSFAGEGEEGYITREHFCSLYKKSADCREYDYICEFCIVYSHRDTVREVHIIKTSTESECREIAEMMSMRANAVTKGEFIEEDKSYFKPPLTAFVTVNGKYAYLIIE